MIRLCKKIKKDEIKVEMLNGHYKARFEKITKLTDPGLDLDLRFNFLNLTTAYNKIPLMQRVVESRDPMLRKYLGEYERLGGPKRFGSFFHFLTGKKPLGVDP